MLRAITYGSITGILLAFIMAVVLPNLGPALDALNYWVANVIFDIRMGIDPSYLRNDSSDAPPIIHLEWHHA